MKSVFFVLFLNNLTFLNFVALQSNMQSTHIGNYYRYLIK